VRLAKKIADEGDALVAGNVCNTWEYDPANPEHSEKIVRPMFEEQVQWAVEEGADETQKNLRLRDSDEVDGLTIGLQGAKSILLVHLAVVI
jgi:hypothetical protein